MDYEVDVFVSYAHLDDAALVEGQKGWVSNLHRALEIRVGQFLGKPPHIWRDPKLNGDDVFAEALAERLRQAALLVSVVSPRYVRSAWAKRELSEFFQAVGAQQERHLQHRSRVFKVLKTPVPLELQSPELRSLLGYEFFAVDSQSGRVLEFDEVFGPDAQRNFWIKLDDLAHDVCEVLDLVEGADVKSGAGAGVPVVQDGAQGTVFLAETTGDLKEQRESIKRNLQQHGYTVLPADPLPQVGADVDAAVRTDLARCSMSVHPIGKRYSLTPEGALLSLVEIQNELAIDRGRKGDFARLVWIPKDLQVEDPRQQQVIDKLRMDSRMGRGADLLESTLEDLRTVIQETLEKARARTAAAAAAVPGPAAAPPAALKSMYLIYDERDGRSVLPWADLLFNQGLEVIHPVFDGDEADVREYHEENLRTADGVVIFYGTANEAWLRRKLRELQKIAGYGRTKPAPVVVTCIVPPSTAEKERFRTHEAIVVAQLEGVAPNDWEPIVARVKG